MAVITAVDFETAMGISGAATPYGTAQERPLFEPGQECYKLGDFPTSAAGNQTSIPITAYTISGISMLWKVVATVTKIMDQTNTFATPAQSDGATARAVPGFNHTTTISGATSATPQSSPYFYSIVDSGGNVIQGIHEKQLTDITGAETYVAAEAAGWIG